METGQRSLIKALLWQTLGLCTMFAVGFLLTGSLATGGKMALINTGIGFVTYFLYERLWSRVAWGRGTGGQ